jgi:glycosidase
MDWVANHASWDNPWIENTSRYSQDSEGNIIHPPGTNWLDVADLNYNNSDMRAAMVDAMKYWIYNANIDGFRCDYADGVPFDFWQSTWETINSLPNREFILFAEGSRSNHFSAGFDLSFSWNFYGAIKNVFNGQSVSAIYTAHSNEYDNIASGKQWIRFTTNHDESAWDATPVELFNGIGGALAASVVTIFTGGVPLIYGSQEVGTANTVPFFYNSTINWSNNPEMLQVYQTMMQFYADSEAARSSQNTVYQHDDVVCFKKTSSTEELLVIVNVRNYSINFTVPMEINSSTWTDVLSQNQILLEGEITLEPYKFYILSN